MREKEQWKVYKEVGVKVEEVVEEMEVEVMVVKLGVVAVLMVEMMEWMVEAGMEEVLRIIAVSC